MEKQYAPTAKEKKITGSKNAAEAPVHKHAEKTEDKKKGIEEKTETKKEIKKPAKKIKREFAVVNADNSRVSTKYAVEICRFIKNKRIGDAIRNLDEVIAKRKPVPMRGEYAHRKGSGKLASGAGKYPVNAAKEFVVLLKSLLGNANANDINEPYISEAMANKAPRPRGRFGRWERKRSHIKLVAKEMKIKENKKSKNKNSEEKK